MIISLLLPVAFSPTSLQTVTLEPVADVWVYHRAGDPGGDPFLRIWGSGGKAVAADTAELENFSYSYLSFSLVGVPLEKITGATLILTTASKPQEGYDYGAFPIEVRGLKGKPLNEKTFVYEDATDITPASNGVFGEAPFAKDSDKIRIELKGKDGDFLNYLKLSKETLSLSLTSKYDIADLGMKGFYKVYSKDNKDETVRPKLILKF